MSGETDTKTAEIKDEFGSGEETKRPMKDPAEPKRSLSAFMLFSQENRSKVKAENPEATFGQLGKLLGEKWASCTDDDKKKFLDQAGKLKEQYEKYKKEYQTNHPKRTTATKVEFEPETEDTKTAKIKDEFGSGEESKTAEIKDEFESGEETKRPMKDPAEPKRSLSAFMLFSQENRTKVKAENPEATFGQLGKLLGEKWVSCTDDDKKKFLDQAAKLKEQYEKDKKEYQGKNVKKIESESGPE